MSATIQVPVDVALFGVPLGPELIVLLLILPLLVLPAAAAYWVYQDATSRGRDDAAFWAVAVGGLGYATFFGGVLALLVYLWERE